MKIEFDLHGRLITLEAQDGKDQYGQFRIGVMVDGKERWYGYMTDKADEE